MNVDLYDIFYYSSLLVSTAAGLYYFKKIEPAFKWLAILMALTFVSELIAKYIAFGLEKTNNIVYHFFTPVEYTIYVIIFLHFLGQPRWKLLVWLSAAGLILLEIVNTIYFQGFEVQNTNTILMESLMLVFLSLLLFHHIRESPLRKDLMWEGVFWFNSAVLCYYANSILITGFQSMKVYLLDNPPLIIYDFNMLYSGLLYIAFAVAIILSSVKSKNPIAT